MSKLSGKAATFLCLLWTKKGMFTERQAPKGQKRPPAGAALGPGHPAGAGCAERHAEPNVVCILLLLQLWDSGAQETDNERSHPRHQRPLLPLLQRFRSIICRQDTPHSEGDMHVRMPRSGRSRCAGPWAWNLQDCWSLQLLSGPLSPSECFLRYLTLPQDNELAIDPRQTVVVVMGHLDRLATLCLPPLCSAPTSHKGSLQEVIGWGLIGWKYYANVIGPIQCEGPANLGVTQIACAEKRFLILSHSGRVHTQAYNSDTLAPQLVQGLASRNIVKIAAHSDSHHCIALAATGEVYSWALGTEDGWAMGTLCLWRSLR
nr:E3 ubiquitin-protein ligase HERC2-like [Chlorocebus sabaeus]